MINNRQWSVDIVYTCEVMKSCYTNVLYSMLNAIPVNNGLKRQSLTSEDDTWLDDIPPLLSGWHKRIRTIWHLLNDPREVIHNSPCIGITFVLLALDPPRKTHHYNVYPWCTSFLQSLPHFSLWSFMNKVESTVCALELVPRWLESPPLRKVSTIHILFDGRNNVLLLAFNPVGDLLWSRFRWQVLRIIMKYQPIFYWQETFETYTICRAAELLKINKVCHQILPRSIRSYTM